MVFIASKMEDYPQNPDQQLMQYGRQEKQDWKGVLERGP